VNRAEDRGAAAGLVGVVQAPRGHPAEDPLEPDEEYPVPESAPGAEEPDPPEEPKPELPVVLISVMKRVV
jgi:hypothetical protein